MLDREKRASKGQHRFWTRLASPSLSVRLDGSIHAFDERCSFDQFQEGGETEQVEDREPGHEWGFPAMHDTVASMR